MAVLKINIPSQHINKVVLALTGGYESTLTDIGGNTYPNPLTRRQAANLAVRQWIQDKVTKMVDREQAKPDSDVDLTDGA